MKPAENRKIEIYSKKWCPYCRKAKAFLMSKGLTYIEYDIDDKSKAEEMARRTDRKTVPQIFINDKHIGGYDDLMETERSGELNRLLGIRPEDYTGKVWELIIIGAGPAGMNAALYAVRKGIDLLLISGDMGGQVIDTEDIDNYLGKKDATGEQLIYDFWEHLNQYNVKSVIGEKVERIIPGKEHVIRTDNG
ncbi:MAG TPA: glutaredoxin 3, partial [Halanaerobiales bacterium]|nr:glutaredoxin 3 [Halanaerobiales bacterium]